MERPKVYSKEHCVQCTATERKLDEMGVDYEHLNLQDVPEQLVQEFRSEGLLQAPVVEYNGERWSGFRPDKLAGIALKQTVELGD